MCVCGEGGCKSELKNLIQKFDLEDSCLIFILRTNIEIKHTVNSFSDHFHSVCIKEKQPITKRKGLLDIKQYLVA